MPHCTKAKPIWDEVKLEYNGKIVNGKRRVFQEYNCTTKTAESTELMEKFGADGFPTVKMHSADGTIIDYDGIVVKLIANSAF